MERYPQSLSFRWTVVLLLVCIRTEHLLAFTGGPNIPQIRSASLRRVQPFSTEAKKSPVSDPADRHLSVLVKCHPDSMELVVQADLFNRGLRVDVGHLRLGSSSAAEGSVCRAAPAGEAEFIIWVHLTGCGMELSSTEEEIIYSNVLSYSPEPSEDGLFRLDAATIPVECHYKKTYALSGVSLHPDWIPLVSTSSAENQIIFHLQLMTENWDFRKGSYSYFLGDPLYFEVSAAIGHHFPLRVYADHCVATATPDVEAPVRYDFIERSGCLADTYLTNSSAHFLPRTEENKLRFQLDAFRFYREPNNQIFVTCYVKAVPVTTTVSSQNRACSLIRNRWRSVDGQDQACASCDISHRSEETPSAEASPRWANQPQPSLPQNGPKQPASHFLPGVHQGHWSGLTQREAEQTVQLGPIAVLSPASAHSRKVPKPVST